MCSGTGSCFARRRENDRGKKIMYFNRQKSRIVDVCCLVTVLRHICSSCFFLSPCALVQARIEIPSRLESTLEALSLLKIWFFELHLEMRPRVWPTKMSIHPHLSFAENPSRLSSCYPGFSIAQYSLPVGPCLSGKRF